MSQIKLEPTHEDQALIEKIVMRAFRHFSKGERRQVELAMNELHRDLVMVHCNSCSLDLQRLLDAGEFDFIHDINGIEHYLDRETGELTECFLPRHHARKAAA